MDFDDEGPYDPEPKSLKKCPACGWLGVTRMRACFRKWDHDSVGGGSVMMIDVRNDHR